MKKCSSNESIVYKKTAPINKLLVAGKLNLFLYCEK